MKFKLKLEELEMAPIVHRKDKEVTLKGRRTVLYVGAIVQRQLDRVSEQKIVGWSSALCLFIVLLFRSSVTPCKLLLK